MGMDRQIKGQSVTIYGMAGGGERIFRNKGNKTVNCELIITYTIPTVLIV